MTQTGQHLNQARQPRGVPVGGQYSAVAKTESSVSLLHSETSNVPDYSTWTPTDIDAELYRLYGEEQIARARRESSYDHVAGEIARKVYNRGWRGKATQVEVNDTIAQWRALPDNELPWDSRDLLRHWERVEKHDAEISALQAEAQPLNDEFDRRGGWTRAFLVTNGNGHVHSSMRCSTCRMTTQYHWVTELSDHDEDEIVDKAGERACTVCYPSAPVETLNKPTELFTPDEIEKAKAREERDAAKVAREAAKIAKGLTADGSEFKVEWIDPNAPGHDRDPATGQSVWSTRPRPQSERFKTEQAATQWLIQQKVYDHYYERSRGPREDGKEAAFEQIIEAIARKHDKTRDEVVADIEQKVAAKIKRESR